MLAWSAVLGMAVATAINLYGAQYHAFTNGHIHGLLYLLIGGSQAAWTLAAAARGLRARRSGQRDPFLPWSRPIFISGAVLSGGVLVLWLLTRVHPPYTVTMTIDAIPTLIGKIGEMLAFTALLRTVPSRRIKTVAVKRFFPSWNNGAMTALTVGLGVWIGALITEPLFPENYSLHNMATMTQPTVPGVPTMNHSMQMGAAAASATDEADGAASDQATASAYFTLVNAGPADALVGVRIEAAGFAGAAASMYETDVTDTLGRMGVLDRVALPTGQAVAFAPIGRHVMLEGLPDTLTPSDEIPLTLVFESGRTVVMALTLMALPPTETGFSTLTDGDFTITDAWAYVTASAAASATAGAGG